MSRVMNIIGPICLIGMFVSVLLMFAVVFAWVALPVPARALDFWALGAEAGAILGLVGTIIWAKSE